MKASFVMFPLLALVGCAPADAPKTVTAGAAPLSADDLADDKSDAGGKVVSGVRFVVGEKVHGSFTDKRGWIGHPIDLVGGQQVEVLLSGVAGDGTAQDTLVYVYGPRDPQTGRYPAQPIAFNDDEQPGELVSSRVWVDVPATGSYRVLVSTYDNWAAYPKNVSRGGYDLRLLCVSGDFGACGQALSYEGESCRVDANCVAEPSVQGAHCEGESTCPEGVTCIWQGAPGVCRGNYVWLTYAPKQCGSNPWQQEGVSPTEGYFNSEELALVDGYFRTQGIDLLEIGFANPAEPRFQCAACTCARGDMLVVKARAHQAATLESRFGFGRLAAETGAQLDAKQCNSNPWSTDGLSAGSAEEAQAVVGWAGSFGAKLSWVGFLYPTSLEATCRACSCPRGDTLFALPADDASRSALYQNGFGDLYLR